MNGGRAWRISFLFVISLFFCIATPVCAASKNVAAATAILDTVAIAHAPVMDANEWHELDGDLLVANLDRSQTGFGFWGLRELLWPIADAAKLANRQKLVRALVEDEQFFASVQTALQTIARSQDRVLAYWQEYDALCEQAKSLYFSTLGSYSASFDEKLNNSSIALECAVAIDGVKRF
ncbi:MAG: hypothetical protein U1E13_15140, partial [Methylophilaceae bacterium]|nr:hypothetical protein [Methylophilaceae bacterium]